MCLHACSGAIHGLSFAQLASGPAFVALGGQHSIVQLSAASGAIQDSWEAGKHPLSAMAMSHDGSRCVLAGALVDVWDPATKARGFRFSGHAVRRIAYLCASGVITRAQRHVSLCVVRCGLQSMAKVAACTQDGTLAATAGSGERTLAVWDASGPPSKKRRTASGTRAVIRSLCFDSLLTSTFGRQCLGRAWTTVVRLQSAGLVEAESPVMAVEMQAVPDTGAVLVAAVLEDGGASVWHYEAASLGAQQTSQPARLRVKAAG